MNTSIKLTVSPLAAPSLITLVRASFLSSTKSLYGLAHSPRPIVCEENNEAQRSATTTETLCECGAHSISYSMGSTVRGSVRVAIPPEGAVSIGGCMVIEAASCTQRPRRSIIIVCVHCLFYARAPPAGELQDLFISVEQ